MSTLKTADHGGLGGGAAAVYPRLAISAPRRSQTRTRRPSDTLDRVESADTTANAARELFTTQAAWDADRCKAHVLLKKYNGDFAEFFAIQKQQLQQRSREAAVGRQNRLARDFEKVSVETDLDARCRQLQAEMDKAINNSNPEMNSSVLHGGVPQRYPTIVLRLELERELDSLLREQVYERERGHALLAGAGGPGCRV